MPVCGKSLNLGERTPLAARLEIGVRARPRSEPYEAVPINISIPRPAQPQVFRHREFHGPVGEPSSGPANLQGILPPDAAVRVCGVASNW